MRKYPFCLDSTEYCLGIFITVKNKLYNRTRVPSIHIEFCCQPLAFLKTIAITHLDGKNDACFSSRIVWRSKNNNLILLELTEKTILGKKRFTASVCTLIALCIKTLCRKQNEYYRYRIKVAINVKIVWIKPLKKAYSNNL